jgi:thioredoxin reductase
MSTGRRLGVIGAGPIGIAAALGASQLGWDVTVLEQGAIGDSVRRWGPTKFFSPLSMNLPPGASAILGPHLPGEDALLTGPEFVDAVLLPLANSEALAGKIKLGNRVVAIGRSGLKKDDWIRHPIRAECTFRVLADTPRGEQTFEFEAIIDASGTYGQPVSLGAGGPARGERAVASRLIRNLGALHEQRTDLAGKTVLLIGHGHSAATAILRLAQLETRVVWCTRSIHRRPCVEVAADPLPERQRVVFEANQLAMNPPAWLQVERRATLEAMTPLEAGKLRVHFTGGREFLVDHVIGLTGYRPDLSTVSELALTIDPATEGSAGLARALSNLTDCLSIPLATGEDLASGEPGFYLAGAKSYGRARTFLLQSGYAQLETILKRLAGDSAA